jgi:SEC-C motif-containing protein
MGSGGLVAGDMATSYAMKAAAPPAPCPCDLGQAYAACCGRWHAGPAHLQAPDAAALMRSRYSAYVLGLDDYLYATWHPDKRPATLWLKEPGRKWLGLEVKRHVVLDGHNELVEFVARSAIGGRADRRHELSRFVREASRWYYVGAEG